MHIMLSQFHSKRHRVAVVAAVGVVVLISGCDAAREVNFDRSNLFTELGTQIDSNAPSDVSGLQGQATYTGVAVADFGNFDGTANVTLTADFDAQTITGSMTSWEDLDPLNYQLRGRVQLSNGDISNDGSFTSEMVGNIERSPLYGVSDPSNPPVLIIFGGTAEGQIYDSVDGDAANYLVGSFTGAELGGDPISGGFITAQ